ncbi:hypothetical protein [Streptomyces sp. NPDC020597]|uniref:hypothetical protein n=1 Tax=unclassified Streptomyces TaxID=2593676 RepID=UPI00378782E2
MSVRIARDRLTDVHRGALGAAFVVSVPWFARNVPCEGLSTKACGGTTMSFDQSSHHGPRTRPGWVPLSCKRVDRVRDLHEFRVQVVELGTSANEEQVADIFVRINFEGVKLNQSDFILTLMSVHWEKGRRQLEDFSRGAVVAGLSGPSPRNAFLDPSPDQLLRVAVAFRRARLQHVYSVLRGKDLESGKVTGR